MTQTVHDITRRTRVQHTGTAAWAAPSHITSMENLIFLIFLISLIIFFQSGHCSEWVVLMLIWGMWMSRWQCVWMTHTWRSSDVCWWFYYSCLSAAWSTVGYISTSLHTWGRQSFKWLSLSSKSHLVTNTPKVLDSLRGISIIFRLIWISLIWNPDSKLKTIFQTTITIQMCFVLTY